jgi:hypothetical protein
MHIANRKGSMPVKDYLDINPMRTLAAILALGQALIILLQILWWQLEEAGLLAVETVWVAFIGVFLSLFKATSPESSP